MMEQPTIQSDDQAEVIAPQPTASLGTMLREAREKQGLSVSDVAQQIKFAPRQIEALEADKFDTPPTATFLRGFVRSYGRLLNLDEETLFAALPEAKVSTLSAAPTPDEMIVSTTRSSHRQNLRWMSAALVFVVVAIGFAIGNAYLPAKTGKEAQVETPVPLNAMETVAQQSAEVAIAASSVAQVVPVMIPPAPSVVKEIIEPPVEKKVTSPAPIKKPAAKVVLVQVPNLPAEPHVTEQEKSLPAEPVTPNKTFIPIDTLLGTQPITAVTPVIVAAKPESKPINTPAPEAATVKLRIVFSEESWTEVHDKNGKSLSSRLNPAGSEINLKGDAPYTLLIGHARSARLYYKGKQVDLKPYINAYSGVAHLALE